MPHCRSSFVRLCARRAEMFGIDVSSLMREYALSERVLEDPGQRLPWDFFAGLLGRLEQSLGGPHALEQFGAELTAAHPLFRLLASLHFCMAEIHQIAAEQFMVHLFDGAVQPLVSRQSDGALRITLSLGRDCLPSYPFWSLILGMWRPFPRLFGWGDSLVEVEMADHFAEFFVIYPAASTRESVVGQEIRRRVRKSLLKDLIRYEELLEMPTPDPRRSILERQMGAAAAPNPQPCDGLSELEQEIRQKLTVERVQFLEITQAGIRRISSVGVHLNSARIRRILWHRGSAIGAVEIERSRDAGHAREASLLDECIDGFSRRFAEIRHGLSLGISSGGYVMAGAAVRDPGLVEPPPSSRGRLARAAQDGRLRELTAEWQLSDRQRSVLALLVDGLGNREIAARLGCSIGTIENHVTKLLKRAGVDCRTALTATFWKSQPHWKPASSGLGFRAKSS